MIDRDKPVVQIERLVSFASEIYPEGEVVFDPDLPPTWIRFRIDDLRTGRIIGQPSGMFHASEIADWSDIYAKKYLAALAPAFACS